jgi:hypothetical protein
LLAGLLGACAPAEPPPPPDSCWTSLDEQAIAEPPRVAWTTVGETSLDDAGLTASMNVPLAGDSRSVALRVSDPAGSAACVQLDDVRDPAAGAWVTPPASLDDYRSYCQSCPERVSVGVGSGLYVLPSGDPPPPAAASLEVRAAARDCATFLPAMPGASRPSLLRVEAITLPDAGDVREGTVLLEVAITSGSSLHGDREASPAVLDAALAAVNTLLAPGRLKVHPVRIRRVDGEDPLSFERGDHATLDDLHREVHACDKGGSSPSDLWVPLYLAGCLRLDDPVQMQATEPNGFVPHVPDGPPPVPGRAHGLFIKGRACDAGAEPIVWSADILARLIAHELGHYLGLYHAVEQDGSTDRLDDTGADNIMHYLAQGGAFSASQLRVMRRHPSVRWE